MHYLSKSSGISTALKMNLIKTKQILSLIKIWQCCSKLAEPTEFASLCSYQIYKKLVSQRKSICFTQKQNSVRSTHDLLLRNTFSADSSWCSCSGSSKLSSGGEPQARRQEVLTLCRKKGMRSLGPARARNTQRWKEPRTLFLHWEDIKPGDSFVLGTSSEAPDQAVVLLFCYLGIGPRLNHLMDLDV